jgi:hypothetical protein
MFDDAIRNMVILSYINVEKNTYLLSYFFETLILNETAFNQDINFNETTKMVQNFMTIFSSIKL